MCWECLCTHLSLCLFLRFSVIINVNVPRGLSLLIHTSIIVFIVSVGALRLPDRGGNVVVIQVLRVVPAPGNMYA